jgi:hypothetical protein
LAKTSRLKQLPATTPYGKSKGPLRADVFVIELLSRFGLIGGTLAFFMTVFLVWGTTEQKREFIDRFILLKGINGHHDYAVFIAILIIIMFLAQRFYYRNQIGIKDVRIKELERYSNSIENKKLKG